LTDQKTIDALDGSFAGLASSEFRGQSRVVVPRESLGDVLRTLKEQLGFDFLADVTCVDYLHMDEAADRFGLVYVLVNTQTDERLVVRTFVGGSEPAVPSVVDLWEGANWLEREVWDLFGIRFDGHPDLRRLVLPENFAAHPLRKDYPLRGYGERHNLAAVNRAESGEREQPAAHPEAR